MKSTGVVRRIDDLGRIVIPKEIRRTLRIKEGDNLEVFVDNEDIVLKKYSMMNKINDLAKAIKKQIFGGWTPGKISASLNEKLLTVKWGEYKIESLFEKLNLGFKKKVFDKNTKRKAEESASDS